MFFLGVVANFLPRYRSGAMVSLRLGSNRCNRVVYWMAISEG